MSALLYVFYLVAAATVFWSMWRFVALTSLSTHVRRALFVLGGTALFTPILAPAFAVAGGLIPSGAFWMLLATQNFADMAGVSRNVAVLMGSSALITAVTVGLLARLFIGEPKAEARRNWTHWVFPAISSVLAVVLVAVTIPKFEVSPAITEARVEQLYGESFDAVAKLRLADSSEARQMEIDRLKRLFESDPVVVEVSLSGGGSTERPVFIVRRGAHFGATNCMKLPAVIGIGRARFRECIAQADWVADLRTLRYVRRESTTVGGAVVVLFDYDRLRARL